MMHRLRDLLWLDAAAGLTVGVLTLSLYRWAEPLYGLPDGALAVVGAANLGYGLFSLSLARRARRPMGLIVALVAANALWAGLCTVALVAWWGTAGALGLAPKRPAQASTRADADRRAGGVMDSRSGGL